MPWARSHRHYNVHVYYTRYILAHTTIQCLGQRLPHACAYMYECESKNFASARFYVNSLCGSESEARKRPKQKFSETEFFFQIRIVHMYNCPRLSYACMHTRLFSAMFVKTNHSTRVVLVILLDLTGEKCRCASLLILSWMCGRAWVELCSLHVGVKKRVCLSLWGVMRWEGTSDYFACRFSRHGSWIIAARQAIRCAGAWNDTCSRIEGVCSIMCHYRQVGQVPYATILVHGPNIKKFISLFG